MTTYSFPDPATFSPLYTTALESWHQSLHEAGVRVLVKFANNDKGAPIKAHGYPALATIRIINLRDRTRHREGDRFDAEMLIDAMEWTDLEHESKLALLDHELSHLGLVSLGLQELGMEQERHEKARAKAEEQGKEPPVLVWWKRDVVGRPRLKSVKGDWSAGDGFVAVCERHGIAAIEYRNLKKCYDRAIEAAAVGEKQK